MGIVEDIKTLPSKFPDTFYSRLTLVLICVQAVVVIALEAVVAGLFLDNISLIEDSPAKGLPVYLVMFCLAQVFQMLICWDAIWHKNSIQLYGFLIFNGAAFCYALFQYFQLKDMYENQTWGPSLEVDREVLRSYGNILIVLPVIIGVFEVAYVYLVYKLVKEFGWRMYKRIGADPHMRFMYQWYQILLMLIKFDVFFAITFSIQFLVLQLSPSDPEFAVTIVAIVVALALAIAAIWGAKHENKPIMIAFMIMLVLSIAYFAFKIGRIYTQWYKYQYTYKYLTFFAAICIIVSLAVLAAAVIVYRNMGEGLKPFLNEAPSSGSTPARSATSSSKSAALDAQAAAKGLPNPYAKNKAPNTSAYSTTVASMSQQGVSLPANAIQIPVPDAAQMQQQAEAVRTTGSVDGVDYNMVVAAVAAEQKV